MCEQGLRVNKAQAIGTTLSRKRDNTMMVYGAYNRIYLSSCFISHTVNVVLLF